MMGNDGVVGDMMGLRWVEWKVGVELRWRWSEISRGG